MIIVKLSGGVGNQLFQYAAARRLSLKRHVALKFDVSGFASEANRRYALHTFQVKGIIASRREIEGATQEWIPGRRHQPAIWLERYGVYVLPRLYKHLDPSFMPELLNASARAYLEGYWQSEHYFYDCQDVLRKELQFQRAWRPEILSIAESCRTSRSVSLHVRRGDYLANAANLATHGLCSLEYYQQALQWLMARGTYDRLVVFSDDPSWAASALKADVPIMIASNHTLDEFEDLFLMTQCTAHVIANSSFSWWGAWLSASPSDCIVGPARWFADTKLDASTIMPASWVKL